MRLPFRIDRERRTGLAEQMVEGFKAAIARGVYRPGEALPGIFELADAAGVSAKVPRTALARLAEEGWVKPRRGVGSVVLPCDAGPEVRGRILVYARGTGYSYYFVQLVSAMRSRFVKAGYRLMTVSASGSRKKDGLLQLEARLKERWNVILESGAGSESRKLIADSGLPFAILGDGAPAVDSNARNCIGRIHLRSGKAVPDFVRACVRKNAKSVLQFVYAEGAFDATDALRVAGVATETVRIPRKGDTEAVVRAAFRATKKHIADGRPFPDVILFTDDYLAQGGFLSLLARGVRIPEDVGVVSHANRGLGPVWLKPVTRLEMDPFAHGAEIARRTISFLQGGDFPRELDLGSVWKPGKTF